MKFFKLTISILFSIFISSCDGGSATTNGVYSMNLPVGDAINGVTLAGPLTGKTVYLLPDNMNPPGCWIDSQYWTGTELFFGISNIDWTSLNNGSIVHNTACNPNPGFAPQSAPGVTGNFNIYRATFSGSQWILTNSILNISQTASISALKATTAITAFTAFVKYEKASANGNIYITQRVNDNSYLAPTAFPPNSATCNDDNPAISPGGNQVIFTSTRNVADGSACSGSSVKTLWSSVYDGVTWPVPTPMTIAPTPTASVDQAWVDNASTTLYWTASGADCAGSQVTTCIRSATGAGTVFTGTPTELATPMTFATWPKTVATPFVSHIGQFTVINNNGFAVCGVTNYVGTSTSAGLTTLLSQSVYQAPNSVAPNYYYYHTDFKSCVIK